MSVPSASLETEFTMTAAGTWTITDAKNNSIVIGFDPTAKQVYIDRTKSGEAGFSAEFPGRHPGAITGNSVKVHAYLDQTTLELFFNDGERVMSERVYLSGPVKLSWNSKGEVTGTVWEMKSIWK
jgi:fructan beta-fructosidase